MSRVISACKSGTSWHLPRILLPPELRDRFDVSELGTDHQRVAARGDTPGNHRLNVELCAKHPGVDLLPFVGERHAS